MRRKVVYGLLVLCLFTGCGKADDAAGTSAEMISGGIAGTEQEDGAASAENRETVKKSEEAETEQETAEQSSKESAEDAAEASGENGDGKAEKETGTGEESSAEAAEASEETGNGRADKKAETGKESAAEASGETGDGGSADKKSDTGKRPASTDAEASESTGAGNGASGSTGAGSGTAESTGAGNGAAGNAGAGSAGAGSGASGSTGAGSGAAAGNAGAGSAGAGNGAAAGNAGAGDGGAAQPPAQTHSCTWDGGSVTQAASCSSEGVMTYRCTSCGNTRTESIPKTEHSLVTESLPATCTEYGQDRVYCSVCGYEQSRTANAEAPLEHCLTTRRLYFGYTEANCQKGTKYNVYCDICGAFLYEELQPALGHDPDLDSPTVVKEGTCRYCAVIDYPCRRCGEMIRFNGAKNLDNHEGWQENVRVEWDPVTDEETRTRYRYCTGCNAREDID